ncbi:MAG: chemotaxis protein CheB, partial [Archangium sp.]|nr:chemotaxis protein CheB [Archangium sp.]
LPEVLVIGASTGGPPALMAVLSGLPENFPAPILVVQHISDAFVEALVHRLDQLSPLPVGFAEPGARLEPGRIVFFRGGANAELVRRDGALTYLRQPAPPNTPHVPSVDALFLSAAQVCGARAWAVLLTGMGRDGAEGMLSIRRAGGFTVAQDQATSVVWGMPRAAFELGGASVLAPLHSITPSLQRALEVLSPAVTTGAQRHSKEEVCTQ